MLKLSLLICCALVEKLHAAIYGYEFTTKLCLFARDPPDGKNYKVLMQVVVPKADTWENLEHEFIGVTKPNEAGKSARGGITEDMYNKLIAPGPRVITVIYDENGVQLCGGVSKQTTFGNPYGKSQPFDEVVPCDPHQCKFRVKYRYNLEIYPPFDKEVERPYAVVSFNTIKTTWDPPDSNSVFPVITDTVHAATQSCDPLQGNCDYEIAFTLECGNETVAQWTVTLPDNQENFEGRDDQSPKIMFTRQQFVKCFMEDYGHDLPNGRLIVQVKDRDLLLSGKKDTLASHEFWLWKPGKPESNSYSPSFRCGAKVYINDVQTEAPSGLKCGFQLGFSVKLFNFPTLITTRYLGPDQDWAVTLTVKDRIRNLCAMMLSGGENDFCSCLLRRLPPEDPKCIEYANKIKGTDEDQC